MRYGRGRSAQAFAGHLDAVLAGDQAAEIPLAELVDLSARVRAAVPAMRPEFRVALRERLVDEARRGIRQPATTPTRAARPWLPVRRLAVAAVAAMVALVVGSLAVAGMHALPGDGLYAIKRGTETVRLRLASGPEARGTVYLALAERRLDEAFALARRDSPAAAAVPGPIAAGGGQLPARTADLVTGSLADMRRDTVLAEGDLSAAWAVSGSRGPLERIRPVTRDQQDRLPDLATMLPAAAGHTALASARFAAVIDHQVEAMLVLGDDPDCGRTCRVQVADRVAAQADRIVAAQQDRSLSGTAGGPGRLAAEIGGLVDPAALVADVGSTSPPTGGGSSPPTPSPAPTTPSGPSADIPPPAPAPGPPATAGPSGPIQPGPSTPVPAPSPSPPGSPSPPPPSPTPPATSPPATSPPPTSPPPSATVPTFTSPSLLTVAAGTAFAVTVATTGSPPAELAVAPGSTLPAGVGLTDHGDGTATLSGTDTVWAGVHPFTLVAANSAGSVTQAFTLTVTSTSPVVGSVTSAQGLGRVTVPVPAAGPGDLLVALVAGDGPRLGGQRLTVSGGGLTWTPAAQESTERGSAAVWWARAPAALGTLPVTAQLARPWYLATITVVTFGDATGIGAVATAHATGGAPTVTLTSTAAGSLVFAAGNDARRAQPRQPGPGQTVLFESTGGSGGSCWSQRVDDPTPAVGVPVTVDDTAPTRDPYNLVAVEIH